MPADADSRTLDVTAFFESAGVTRFHIWLLVVSSFVTLFDGLDFALISVVLPYLRDDLRLDAAMMGWVTSAAFAGQMIGRCSDPIWPTSTAAGRSSSGARFSAHCSRS